MQGYFWAKCPARFYQTSPETDQNSELFTFFPQNSVPHYWGLIEVYLHAGDGLAAADVPDDTVEVEGTLIYCYTSEKLIACYNLLIWT